MPRGNQTFQKRQREIKLREKAQLKRERRQQRQNEKKQRDTDDLSADLQNYEPVSVDVESGENREPDV
ncbi:MAG: hypothetical protein ACRD2B_11770 [Terriglobia bacterium]